jgi:hypothetical protein
MLSHLPSRQEALSSNPLLPRREDRGEERERGVEGRGGEGRGGKKARKGDRGVAQVVQCLPPGFNLYYDKKKKMHNHKNWLSKEVPQGIYIINIS